VLVGNSKAGTLAVCAVALGGMKGFTRRLEYK